MKTPHNPKNLTAPQLAKLFKKYAENEEDNCHAENTVLLAKNFGDEEDQALAESNLKVRDRLGYRSEKLAPLVYEIQSRCWVHAVRLAAVLKVKR